MQTTRSSHICFSAKSQSPHYELKRITKSWLRTGVVMLHLKNDDPIVLGLSHKPMQCLGLAQRRTGLKGLGVEVERTLGTPAPCAHEAMATVIGPAYYKDIDHNNIEAERREAHQGRQGHRSEYAHAHFYHASAIACMMTVCVL